ncbi:MAG: DNA-binding protein WhiA [Ruminococcus sp.]|nr:DNA-binding protein WhiA [Candidatus Copronaster equi]
MSFTADVKNELTQIEEEKECCRHAYAYGFLLFGKSFSSRSIMCASDYKCVIDSFCDFIESETGFIPEKNTLQSGKHTLKIKTTPSRKSIIEHFGHGMRDISLRINYGNFEDECCFGAFLRGVFLTCGSIANPDKNYHLEFVVPYYRLSQDLLKFLIDRNINAKYILRKYTHVVYIKESESIEDLMTLMGAVQSSLTLMGIKIQKDVRNNINRQMNFESANMNRAIDAGLAQIDAINLIEKKQGLDSLPDELKELAILRKNNPDWSLKMLGANLQNPISRSGVNHRFAKILEIAEKYK